MPQVCGPLPLALKRSDENGIAISTVKPSAVSLPADAHSASHEVSSLPVMSFWKRSICTPSGLTKNSKARRSSLKVSRTTPTKSSEKAESRSRRRARIFCGSGSCARTAT